MRTVNIQRWLLLCFTLIILVCAIQGCCRLFSIDCEYPVELYMLYSVTQQRVISEANTDSERKVEERQSVRENFTDSEESYRFTVDSLCRYNGLRNICEPYYRGLGELQGGNGPCTCHEITRTLILSLPDDNRFRYEIAYFGTDEFVPFQGRLSGNDFTFIVHDINNQTAYPYISASR